MASNRLERRPASRPPAAVRPAPSERDSAELNGPIGLAVDSAGALSITDWNNNRVRKAVFQILK